MKPEPHHDIGSVVGDARKRRAEEAALEEFEHLLSPLWNHDEQHAHLHEWPDMDDS